MLKMTYETRTEIDENKHHLYPLGAILGFILIITIALYFIIPILVFLFVYAVEPYFYRLFTKRNLLVLILAVNSFFIAYLFSIIQSK